MKIDIITLFPEMFEGPFRESILKRAQDKDLVEIRIHNLRKWALDKRKQLMIKPFWWWCRNGSENRTYLSST